MRTIVRVTGLRPEQTEREEFDRLNEELVMARIELSKAKQRFAIYTNTFGDSPQQRKDHESARELYFMSRERVREIEKR